MNKKQRQKIITHLSEAKPRYIRVYDNGGKSIDRYTVVFTGNYRRNTKEMFIYLTMSEYPLHPQGVCQHGFSKDQIDRPRYSHLGRLIEFDDMPLDCKTMTLLSYVQLWDIPLDDKEVRDFLSGVTSTVTA